VVATALFILLQASAPTLHASSLFVFPQAVTLAPGSQEQFSATGSGDAEVLWEATGGTMTRTGLYTAGATEGSFTVTALLRDGTSHAVTVTISSAAPIRSSPAPVSIDPGENIQAAVNAYPAGTAFLIKQGVHRRQTIRPKDGMSFVGEAGAVLDGEDVTAHAFVADESRDVTVRGLRITRYLPRKLTAAFEGGSESQAWVVEGNEIHHNSNGNLRVYGLRIGSGWIVRGNSIHHNGWVGIEGYQAVDTLIEGNEVYANPPSSFRDTIGEAANMKLYDCGRIIIRNNFVHDSPFRGIWLDTSRPDMIVEGNRVVNHGEAGIWYEVSYQGIIRHNYVENAGYNSYYSSGWLRGGGIQVTNSPDVSVIENTVVNSLNGIIGLQADGYEDGPYGPNELRNLLVQGNTVVMPRGQTGIAENIGSNTIFLSWNNRFVGNRYELAANATPFYWMGRNLDERQWQSFGVGATDSFVR
jgi:parallel beta-helix repeat protein